LTEKKLMPEEETWKHHLTFVITIEGLKTWITGSSGGMSSQLDRCVGSTPTGSLTAVGGVLTKLVNYF